VFLSSSPRNNNNNNETNFNSGMLGALTGYELASIILESVVVSYAFELCVRNLLLLKNDKTLGIHIGKALLGFCFAIKTSFFLSFYTE
jgi:type IV secretory pathway TrbL component